jgi:hypothetical protein
MGGGSDGAADRWRNDYRIEGADGLELHHLYRAMAWLGEELPTAEQAGRTPFAPRCTKDLVEERLFAARRDLFSRLDLLFLALSHQVKPLMRVVHSSSSFLALAAMPA